MRFFTISNQHLIKTKFFLFLFGFVFFCMCVRSQTPNYCWAKDMGGINNEYGKSLATDIYGNLYTVGNFMGTVDFDPGSGVFNLTSNGFEDIFILKLNASGNFLWAKQIGGSGHDDANSVIIDGSGNLLITGYFAGTVDFDPSPNTYNITSNYGCDVFVLKLYPSGNFAWAKYMGGNGFDSGNSITIDASDNVYTTGTFIGSVDFDPGLATFSLTTTGTTPDIFVSKLNTSGDFIWAKQIGDTSYASEMSNSIKIYNNHVYITGYYSGTIDFDPSPTTFTLSSISAYSSDFISKWDTSGNFIWVKQFGGNNTTIGRSLAIDNSGCVLSTGYFAGTSDFDPGPSVFNLTSNGGVDIFVSKLDSSGNFLWAKQLGGKGSEYGFSITVDNVGNIFTTGFFSDTVDFDPGVGVINFVSKGGMDIFMSELDNSGNYMGAGQIGSNADDHGNSITVDNYGDIFITGYFNGVADFDISTSVANLSPVGNIDVFTVKYGNCTISDTKENYVSDGNIELNPNPANNLLKIVNKHSSLTIKVYSIDGSLIEQRQISESYNLDVNNYQNGLYLIVFQDEHDNVFEKKFIKL